jgi:hypothetical protein
LVEVRIEGVDELDSPVLALCAADVTAETATTACDLTQLDRLDAQPGDPASVREVQTVAVRRIIRVTRSSANPNTSVPFDCATEPVGCVLAVGSGTLPTRGALVPIEFDPSAPIQTPELQVEPATGLQPRQAVSIVATGLRPNSTYAVRQCAVDVEDGCDETSWRTGRTDADGTLLARYPALPAIYGWRGRTDCTLDPCVITVGDAGGGERLAATELRFADDVAAPVPTMSVSPVGPYRDGQEVTLTGEGFPPGVAIGDQIGQCPDGKDTAVEERCAYPALGRTTVADDGTFSMTLRLTDSLISTGPCAGDIGCHLGWVLPHGPTVARVDLDFS